MLIDLSQSVRHLSARRLHRQVRLVGAARLRGAGPVHHALRGAVDRLRARRQDRDADRVLVLLDRRRRAAVRLCALHRATRCSSSARGSACSSMCAISISNCATGAKRCRRLKPARVVRRAAPASGHSRKCTASQMVSQPASVQATRWRRCAGMRTWSPRASVRGSASPSNCSPAEPASTVTHSGQSWSYQKPSGLACARDTMRSIRTLAEAASSSTLFLRQVGRDAGEQVGIQIDGSRMQRMSSHNVRSRPRTRPAVRRWRTPPSPG